MGENTVRINRAPVLTLWATVVAARMGYEWEEALSLGKAVAGFNAQTKGRMLGIYRSDKKEVGQGARKTGLGEDFLAGDLTVVGSLAGGGDLGPVDLIYIPEPATMVLLGLGVFAAMVLRQC